MLALLLAFAFSYTISAKDVLQPPARPAMESWTSPAVQHRQTVELRTAEGDMVRGWLYAADNADAPYVLFFYGSSEDLSHEANRLQWLRDTFQVNAICFDYTGFGFSEGSIDASRTRSAALEEFDYVRKHLAAQDAPIVVYGWSIGTGMAIHVAANRPAAGLILQAPPASSDAMALWSSDHDVPRFLHGMVKVKVGPAVKPLYDGAASIAGVSTPLLVIHGQLDDVVPLAQGRQVFAASAATQKEFVEVPGSHHNDLPFTKSPAADAVGNFLKAVRSGRAAATP